MKNKKSVSVSKIVNDKTKEAEENNLTIKEEDTIREPTPVKEEEVPVIKEEARVDKEVVKKAAAPIEKSNPSKTVPILEEMLQDYSISCKSIRKEADKPAVVRKLGVIIRQALKQNDAEAAVTLLKFFGENKNTVLSEVVVFQHIRTLSHSERKPIESCYTFLMAAIEKFQNKEPFRLDIGAIRVALNAEEFVNTIVKKLER